MGVSVTLLLRFAGPFQSWGTSDFITRNSEVIPTRSGVVGLLAACLGWGDSRPEKGASLLDEVEIAVRVESPGWLVEDFHTVTDPGPGHASRREQYVELRTGKTAPALASRAIPSGDGKPWNRNTTLVTRRRYLADAEFLVAIGGGTKFVSQLAAATRNPVFMPYLGRKACAPAFPFWFGTHRQPPTELLASLPTHRSAGHAQPVHQVTGDQPSEATYVLAPTAATDSVWGSWKGAGL